MTLIEYKRRAATDLKAWRNMLVGPKPDTNPDLEEWTAKSVQLGDAVQEAMDRRIMAALHEHDGVIILDGNQRDAAWTRMMRWLHESMNEVEKAWLRKEEIEKNAPSLMAFLEEEARRQEENDAKE